MLIIFDKRLPGKAKEMLATSGRKTWDVGRGAVLIELETEGVVYPAISGHPDIFFCKTPGNLIVSRNLPEKYHAILSASGIPFTVGNNPTGLRHPATVHFNAAVNDNYLVHRLEVTDPVILENCHTQKKVNVSQGYTRCNMAWLKNDHYVTSDKGIHKTLQEAGLEGILVSPEGIILPGFPNGFIGGTIGICGNTILFTGSLSFFPEGEKLRNYIVSMEYEILELYEGPLIDGGGVLIMNNEQ